MSPSDAAASRRHARCAARLRLTVSVLGHAPESQCVAFLGRLSKVVTITASTRASSIAVAPRTVARRAGHPYAPEQNAGAIYRRSLRPPQASPPPPCSGCPPRRPERSGLLTPGLGRLAAACQPLQLQSLLIAQIQQCQLPRRGCVVDPNPVRTRRIGCEL